jgi:carbonic anhydrase
MRLFESIVDANHRALAGDSKAGVHVADFPGSLPLVALTCIDPRLNRFFPGVLGLPEEQFIWLRNAGNIIFDSMSSMMRTLALGCAIKGGREIAIIGHTDCKVRQTSISALTDLLKGLGIDRSHLPENLTEFFGLFASERQNVLRGVEFIRNSPLIGPKIPVHGLLVDIETGKLEWLVNGYEALERPAAVPPPGLQMPTIGGAVAEMTALAGFNLGEMKFPETKIGETTTEVHKWVSQTNIVPPLASPTLPHIPPPLSAEAPPAIEPSRHVPLPPPIPSKPLLRKTKKF